MNTVSTLTLVKSTDPILRAVAAPVTDHWQQVMPHVDAMFEVMERGAAVRGVGLAAPQVGIPFRFFVTTLAGMRVIINPTITKVAGIRASKPEGCLSFSGGKSKTFVARPVWVEVEWTDHKGGQRAGRLTDFAARVFQHETDHLNGICIFK